MIIINKSELVLSYEPTDIDFVYLFGLKRLTLIPCFNLRLELIRNQDQTRISSD